MLEIGCDGSGITHTTTQATRYFPRVLVQMNDRSFLGGDEHSHSVLRTRQRLEQGRRFQIGDPIQSNPITTPRELLVL
jgi:hypothetical protein